jgi:hypothetical protein
VSIDTGGLFEMIPHMVVFRSMGVFGVIVAVMGALSGVAEAGPFTSKTSQGELSRRVVDRPFVMPKGWLEVATAVDSKTSQAYRGSDGGLREQPKGMSWNHARLWLEVRQGFSDRVTLYGRVPWVRSSLRPAGGNEITTLAMGDAHTGLVVQPMLGGPGSFAVSLDLKAPSGVEWPSGSGGPANTSSFLTGTGATNLSVLGHAKWAIKGMASMAAELGYVRKFPAIVGYVVAQEGFGNGVINPGDEWILNTDITAMAGSMVSLAGQLNFRRMGESSVGINGSEGRQMSALRHTGGDWVDVGLSLSVEPSAHWGVELSASQDLKGGDTRTFAHLGLEELAPQPGRRFGTKVVARW